LNPVWNLFLKCLVSYACTNISVLCIQGLYVTIKVFGRTYSLFDFQNTNMILIHFGSSHFSTDQFSSLFLHEVYIKYNHLHIYNSQGNRQQHISSKLHKSEQLNNYNIDFCCDLYNQLRHNSLYYNYGIKTLDLYTNFKFINWPKPQYDMYNDDRLPLVHIFQNRIGHFKTPVF
jgi:hypothetical protein